MTKRWLLLATMTAFFAVWCLFLDGALAITAQQAKTFISNNGWLKEHTPYCDQCRSVLAINTSKLATNYDLDLCNYLETHQMASKVVRKAHELGVTVRARVYRADSYEPLTDWVKLSCEVTIRPDRIYELKLEWTRNLPEAVDWQILNISKWATWSPATYETNYPLNLSFFREDINHTQLWQFNFSDSNSKSLEYQIEYSNGTIIKSYTRIDNRTFVETDTDCDEAGNFNACVLDMAQTVDFVYNITNWISPTDYDTANYHIADVTDFYTPHAAYYYDKDAWIGENTYAGGNNAKAIFDMPDTIPDGLYYFAERSIDVVNVSLDGGQSWFKTTDDNAGAWQEANHKANISDNNLTVYLGRGGTTVPNLDGLQFYAQDDWGNLTFELDLSEHLSSDGTYIMRYRSYNKTMDGVNTTYALQFEYDDTSDSNDPTCTILVDFNHFEANISTFAQGDGLSISGCWQSLAYDNGTWANETWTEDTSNWVNYTLQHNPDLEFYGKHYISTYCNDSLNQIGVCSSSYVLYLNSGLTSDQNSTLYSTETYSEDVYNSVDDLTAIIIALAMSAVLLYLSTRTGSPYFQMLFLGVGFLFAILTVAIVDTIYTHTLVSTYYTAMVWTWRLVIAVVFIFLLKDALLLLANLKDNFMRFWRGG